MENQSLDTKIIIIGAGIAGPVLATFLKIKGYAPVLYERTSSTADRGIGIGLASNGLSVLCKIPGLLESMDSVMPNKFLTYSMIEEDKGLLVEIPCTVAPPGGHRTIGVRRSALHKAGVNTALKHGAEIHWDHKLVDLRQHEDSVTVRFENGMEDTASFVIGCDGLHSGTRICLFGEEKADYTGLVQTGGIAPTPEFLKNDPAFFNIFGNGAHVISIPVDSTHSCWALTQRESEASKESWSAIDNRVADEVKKSPFASWDYGIADLIKTTDNIIKYGLYDRPELKTWHKGRVLLIGDAAHPTSPHSGQGANQALEDIDMLVTLLEKFNPTTASPSTELLETLFNELEAQRIPRSSEMVKNARKQGDSRVVEGVEACLKRNREFQQIWKKRG